MPEVGSQGMQEMLSDIKWAVAEIVYTDRDATQGEAIVYAKAPPPVARFKVEVDGGMPYEVHIRPVGRASQQRFDEAGLGNEPREHQRAHDANDPDRARRGKAALARTQPASPAAPAATTRPREPSGGTPLREVRPRGPEG